MTGDEFLGDDDMKDLRKRYKEDLEGG